MELRVEYYLLFHWKCLWVEEVLDTSCVNLCWGWAGCFGLLVNFQVSLQQHGGITACNCGRWRGLGKLSFYHSVVCGRSQLWNNLSYRAQKYKSGVDEYQTKGCIWEQWVIVDRLRCHYSSLWCWKHVLVYQLLLTQTHSEQVSENPLQQWSLNGVFQSVGFLVWTNKLGPWEVTRLEPGGRNIWSHFLSRPVIQRVFFAFLLSE